MEITPLRVVKMGSMSMSSSQQNGAVDLTLGMTSPRGKLKPRNLCFHKGRVPHATEVIDLTIEENVTPSWVVKSKSVEQDSSGENTHCEVTYVTIGNNVSQPKVDSVMLTAEQRCSPRLKELPEDNRQHYGSDCKRLSNSPNNKVSSERNKNKSLKRQLDAYEHDLFSKRPTKDQLSQSSLPDVATNDVGAAGSKSNIPSGQNTHCVATNLTIGKKVCQPQVDSVMLTPERRCSLRLKEIPEDKRPYYASDRKRLSNSPNDEISGERNVDQLSQSSLPDMATNDVGAAGSKSNISGRQNTHCELSNLTIGKNVCRLQVDSVMLTPERRCSPRLKEIPEDKRPYYGSEHKRLSSSPNDKVSSEMNNDKSLKRQLDAYGQDLFNKRPKKDQLSQSSLHTNDMGAAGSKSKISNVSVHPANDSTAFVELEDTDYLKWTNYDQFIADSINEKASAKVKEMEEEKRCKKVEEGRSPSDVMQPSKRPDLKALSEMLWRKETLNIERSFSHIPGVPVGYKFFSRAEMATVGFHGHWFQGIDYIGKFARNLDKYKGCTAPLAVAIVLSGQYEDGVDEVIYTGQGGNDLFGKKRQVKDQVMLRGNLALKNNMEQSIPVRVLHGHECGESCSHKVYTYCGLYKVVKHWAEKGVSGLTVFKYRLIRLLGQPMLDIDQVAFERRPNSSSNLLGLICEDISFGEEVLPVPVTNVVDFAKIVPSGFKYINSVQFSSTITIPPSAPGCKCKGKCTNPKTCSCARLNGSDFPYVHKNGGRLVEPKDVVFECGPGCTCGPKCINRISQRPLKYRLEVYRTENKGWAVRSWDFIPSGAPVCEYTGIVRRNDDLDNVSDNEFIFEIDCWHTMHGLGGREKRQGDDSSRSSLQRVDDKIAESESDFCIDGSNCGNVSRFINHSCDPNLFVQCVLSSHHDVRLARIVLFAADNIPPMQELTYDYGYALDSVVGPDGKLKHKPCYCGTSECRDRLY